MAGHRGSSALVLGLAFAGDVMWLCIALYQFTVASLWVFGDSCGGLEYFYWRSKRSSWYV